MNPAREALERLREGNRRYVRGDVSPDVRPARRVELDAGQSPFAVILGCSDSRVPAELVFDQGLGDLFVVRVAGNVATPTQIGSVEYAVANLGTRLVVVMGHSRCGAVDAAIGVVRDGGEAPSENLAAIVAAIRPAVEQVLAAGGGEALAQQAMEVNVAGTVDRLRADSPILRRMIDEQGLLVVGAAYSLASGEVEFFEGPSS